MPILFWSFYIIYCVINKGLNLLFRILLSIGYCYQKSCDHSEGNCMVRLVLISLQNYGGKSFVKVNTFYIIYSARSSVFVALVQMRFYLELQTSCFVQQIYNFCLC